MQDFKSRSPTNDGVIAHEMTHAVMDATLNVGSIFANAQTFFMEGTAELMRGADDRLYADIGGAGGANIAAVMGKVAAWGSSWDGSSAAYSAAYAGMRYLDAEIKAAGGSGIKDVTTYMAADPTTRTLDQALANATHGAFTGLSDFKTQFQADGATFIGDLLSSGKLANADAGRHRRCRRERRSGAKRGCWSFPTSRITVAKISSTASRKPGRSWPRPPTSSANKQKLQIGANVNESFDIGTFAMNGMAMGIMDADVSVDAECGDQQDGSRARLRQRASRRPRRAARPTRLHQLQPRGQRRVDVGEPLAHPGRRLRHRDGEPHASADPPAGRCGHAVAGQHLTAAGVLQLLRAKPEVRLRLEAAAAHAPCATCCRPPGLCGPSIHDLNDFARAVAGDVQERS